MSVHASVGNDWFVLIDSNIDRSSSLRNYRRFGI